jgi:hypothetical protein
LTWTATGDNGGEGTATRYEIRYAQSDILNETDWTNATEAPNSLTPRAPGETETFIVENLPGETTVFFALKVFDDQDRSSPISTTDSVDTPGVAPAAVDDLAAVPVSETSIRLNWTAVGDDGNEPGTQASSYDIRWSPSPILTNDDFNAATPFNTSGLTPGLQGSAQTFLAGGLSPDTPYHFALKVSDEVPNVSGLSNLANASTTDETDPAPIINLAATVGGTSYELQPAAGVTASHELAPYIAANAADGNPDTFWMTPLVKPMQVEWIAYNLGAVYDIGRVTLYSRTNNAVAFPHTFEIQVSTGGAFTTVHTDTVFPAAPGTAYTFTFGPVPASQVRLRITRVNLYGTKYSVQLAQMEVYKVVPAGVALTWTAPGDNGTQGTAYEYELRYLEGTTIHPGNFTSGTLAIVPAPQPAGSSESLTVLGLTPGDYHFMIKTSDEAGNVSYSNEATITVNP